MKEPNCFIFVFDSTHQALSGERALRDSGIHHDVINTPREFSVDCGISLRIEPDVKEEARCALEARGVIYASLQPYHSRWISK